MCRRAIVFAYHNVGVRCLKVLLAAQVDIALIISHADDPQETIWFGSVPQLAADYGIPCITPKNVNSSEVIQQVTALAPDFIFSFYYRQMIPSIILASATIGAFNMHGSLLPKYRGRAPVNWAVLHGEKETGATLHEMVEKPDAGAIIHQLTVPILPDDLAHEVFDKVSVAAELTLWQALPNLLAGDIHRQPNLLATGSYFGGRKPEDGRIDWTQSAQSVYNLYRAVAPPYPGAFTEVNNHRLVVARARLLDNPTIRMENATSERPQKQPPGLQVINRQIFGVCGDGNSLLIQKLIVDGQEFASERLAALLAVRHSYS